MPPAAAILARPICNLLGCTFPLALLAGNTASAAAVIEAGGFAFLPPHSAATAHLTQRRFGIVLDSAAPEAIAAAIARSPAAVLLERDDRRRNRRRSESRDRRMSESGMDERKRSHPARVSEPAPAAVEALGAAHIVLLRRVTSAAEAALAERKGCHALIADCADFSRLSDIIAVTNIAVLASAPADAQAFATILALGADGAAIADGAALGSAGDLSALIAATASLLDSGAAPPAERVSYASPACFAEEAEDAFMGFVPPSELVPALNSALEEARAAARLACDPSLASRHTQELRWCGVLTTAILATGARPSRRIAAWPGTTPPDLAARTARLDRAAAQRAALLSALLPKIRDDAIYAALAAMLARPSEPAAPLALA